MCFTISTHTTISSTNMYLNVVVYVFYDINTYNDIKYEHVPKRGRLCVLRSVRLAEIRFLEKQIGKISKIID